MYRRPGTEARDWQLWQLLQPDHQPRSGMNNGLALTQAGQHAISKPEMKKMGLKGDLLDDYFIIELLLWHFLGGFLLFQKILLELPDP